MKVKETHIVSIVKTFKPGYRGFFGNRNYLEEVTVYLLEDDTYRLVKEDGKLREISKETFEEYKKNSKLTPEEVEELYVKDFHRTSYSKPFYNDEKSSKDMENHIRCSDV